MSTISASTTSTTAYKVTADTTGTLVLQTGASPTTAVTIDTSQRVGFGTASPSAKVQISSGSGGDTTGLRITRTDTGGGDWKIWSTATVNGEGAGKLVFGTAANNLILDGSGNAFALADVYVNGTAKLSRNPLVQANNTSGQTFSAATTTKVLFQNASVDTNTCFSSSTFTPNVAGYYLIYAQISPTANSSQEITLQLAKNGSSINRLARQPGNASYAIYFGGTMLVYCNGSTDYIEIFCFTQGTFTSETPYTTFSATFVRNA